MDSADKSYMISDSEEESEQPSFTDSIIDDSDNESMQTPRKSGSSIKQKRSSKHKIPSTQEYTAVNDSEDEDESEKPVLIESHSDTDLSEDEPSIEVDSDEDYNPENDLDIKNQSKAASSNGEPRRHPAMKSSHRYVIDSSDDDLDIHESKPSQSSFVQQDSRIKTKQVSTWKNLIDDDSSFETERRKSTFVESHKISSPNERIESKDPVINIESDSSSHSNSNSNFNSQIRNNDPVDSDSDYSPKIENDAVDSDSDYSPRIAASLAREEVKVEAGHVDPFIAQRRALVKCNIEHVKNQLAKSKMLLQTVNMEMLPDNGEKVKENILKQEIELRQLQAELDSTPFPQDLGSFKTEDTPVMEIPDEQSSWDQLSGMEQVDRLGKKALETRQREQALTVERLQALHGSLAARPTEDEKADDPRGLRVPLMAHQKHALSWLLWREGQKPPGGVLADDMGLGKTLTMIALVMASMAEENSDKEDDSDSNDDEEWVKKPIKYKGGTLVVCPASLLQQWEGEVKNRCKSGILSVRVYHGNNRDIAPKRLARDDMVVTTYNLISREFKSNGPLFKIRWKRVILDEAHVIRNHKSQQSQAACGVIARKRWALTGTPIQNKELDLYAILKFLRCSPFDDLRVWKRWVDNKSSSGQERLATVMKTLMLRRTKQELQSKGTLVSLPDKNYELIEVDLDPEERLVYEKVLVYSSTLFAQFLHQRAEKAHTIQLNAGKYDAPSFLSQYKNTEFTKAQKKLLELHADVKSHEILVLLLRLRQICCHPALIHAMLDREEVEQNGIDGEELDSDLISRVDKMNLSEIISEDKENDIGVDARVKGNLLTSENPVFEDKRISSKVKAVLSTVEEILEKGDKVVIVSQWTSMLNVVESHLSSLKGASFKSFTGHVAVKDRQSIIEAFNDPKSSPRILLLSLTAGGVGLNLVGGNHLLLIDIHWNPQLETQAQDRIYRFGQKKSVYIYKFICKDTIEERIQVLQGQKLNLAQGVLTGARNVNASKLTLDDLKSLFNIF